MLAVTRALRGVSRLSAWDSTEITGKVGISTALSYICLHRSACSDAKSLMLKWTTSHEAGGARMFERSLSLSSASRGSSALPVGVIGAGRVASSVHIPNILDNRRLELRWIVENNPAAVESVQAGLNLRTPFYSSSATDELLSDNSVEAVFVFTPTPTHYSVIMTCLEKGKAVFTEKPTAESLADIEHLYDTADRTGKPLFTAYNRRFDPTYSHIYRMLVAGELGKLLVAKVTTRDSPKPSYDLLRSLDRSGCNIITDVAVHDFDFLTWIMQGEAPETVFVMTHAHDPVMADIGQADVSGVVLKYPGGAMAMIDSARESSYGYDSRVELFGSLGMASAENPRENFATLDSKTGAQRRRMMHSFPQRFRESFVAEIDHFIDCVEGKASPLVTKEDCIMTGLVMEAALESFRLNQAVNFPHFLSQRALGAARPGSGSVGSDVK